jgi:fibronectin-binding autotransporter adhesin
MCYFRLSAALLLLVFVQASSAGAALVTIADYQSDFQGVTPATGWNYQTNSGGAIGNSANYANLAWSSVDAMYNLDGGTPLPRSGSYVFLNGGGGHPGPGTSEGAAQDRYAIAAYTIQATDITGYLMDGPFQLTATSINDADLGGGTLSLHVYVNNTLIGPAQVLPGNTTAVTTFDRTLGNLVVGDTVYVAVGPNGSHGNDAFGMFDFTIQLDGHIPAAPEPSTALLLGLGLVGLSTARRDKATRRRSSIAV